MSKQLHEGLQALGNSAVNKELYQQSGVNKELLEAFPSPFELSTNRFETQPYIHIVCPEFTSLCPLTSQSDFATIEIDYIPKHLCVESKSLKLYIFSFRNQGEFHEACCNRILQDLVELVDPQWMRVTGKFTPRGGIPIWPVVQYGTNTLAHPAGV